MVKKTKINNDSMNEMKKCCVINCGKRIAPGKGVKIGEKVYCSTCGTLILKEIIGLG